MIGNRLNGFPPHVGFLAPGQSHGVNKKTRPHDLHAKLELSLVQVPIELTSP